MFVVGLIIFVVMSVCSLLRTVLNLINREGSVTKNVTVIVCKLVYIGICILIMFVLKETLGFVLFESFSIVVYATIQVVTEIIFRNKIDYWDSRHAFTLTVISIVCVVIAVICAFGTSNVYNDNPIITESIYELREMSGDKQNEGEIEGSRYHISGQIKGVPVYDIVYWEDDTTWKPMTIERENTVFEPLPEGKKPYIHIYKYEWCTFNLNYVEPRPRSVMYTDYWYYIYLPADSISE